MKTGFFLTARLGSTRLPRKHLLEAAGRPLLGVLAQRILSAFASEVRSGDAMLAVVTSDEPENRAFERFNAIGVKVFYGAVDNIPLRHHQAAQHFGVGAVVAVDGDDILCSPAAMRAVRDMLRDSAEYASTAGLPLGMNAFGYRSEFLAASVAGNERRTLETGWGHIFDKSRLVQRQLELGLAAPDNLRFTLDYPEDYAFFKAIVEHFGDAIAHASDRDIVACVLAQGLNRLTDPVAEKYWENFRSAQAEEIRRG